MNASSQSLHMKGSIALLAFLSITVPVGLIAADKEELAFHVEPSWRLANSAKGPKHSSIAEYVRQGDDINSWKELLTIQSFGKLPGNPSLKEMLKALQTQREAECPGTTQWTVIESADNSILYEWHASPCLGWPEQCEIARMIIGDRLVFTLRYTAKIAQLPLETRSKWIRDFSDVTITRSN